MSNKRVKRVISNLNKQSTFDCLKAGLLRVIRPRNNKKTSDQITQKSTKASLCVGSNHKASLCVGSNHYLSYKKEVWQKPTSFLFNGGEGGI